jgi:mannose-6-phosphate isomerase-like protein (cupin superfamily)
MFPSGLAARLAAQIPHQEVAMSGYAVKSIDEMQGIHDGLVRLAGAELGIESFGLQVLDFPPDFAHYPEHDHAADGQEEVYVVLHGSGAFEIDGERVTVDEGQMVRIEAPSRRKLHPGSEGIRILAIGSAPGGTYERPEDFRLRANA